MTVDPRTRPLRTQPPSASGPRHARRRAGWLRRQGHRRQLALGAIAGGAVLFLVASLTQLAGADPVGSPRSGDGPGRVAALRPVPSGTATGTASVATTPAAALPAPPPVGDLAANGIPGVALNAYRVAAARVGGADPRCGIDWALLAAIGRVESDHGRFGGTALRVDGTSVPKIIGPALDGVRFPYVPAPADGMALDGDATYAHALGPMQFIPSTWALYGASATGTGPGDVFDINDAALGAARYLCAAGGDLRTHDGLVRAVLAYNHVDAYVATVIALADAYRGGVPVSGIPIGDISGALPPLRATGTPPPADPGGPTAVEPAGSGASPGLGASTDPATRAGSPPAPAPQQTPAPRPASSVAPPAPSSAPAPSRPSGATATPPSNPSPTKPCDLLSHLLGWC